MKKLLVGSVFSPTHRNETFVNLHYRYLSETLGDQYDHAVWLNRVGTDLFKSSKIAGMSDEPGQDPRHEHAEGLNGLMDFFEKNPDYENYLILDSDAFPFRANWLEKLLMWMKEDDRLPERQWAAAVRTENLDTFPHPCVFFVKGSWFRERRTPPYHEWNWGVFKQSNMLGYPFEDVSLKPEEVEHAMNCGVFQPMTRTNFWNPHPILSAIYGGMFYHHGAGSRAVELRSVSLRQFDHHVPRFSHLETEAALWLEVSKNPNLFVRQLAEVR